VAQAAYAQIWLLICTPNLLVIMYSIAGWMSAAGATVGVVLYSSFFIGGWVAAAISTRRSYAIPSMKGKVVIVTGGNGGIGARCVAALAGAGATVILACRSMERGENVKVSLPPEVASQVEIMNLDLSSFASIKAFSTQFQAKFPRLHVLILNGAVAKTFLGNSGYKLTSEGFEEMVGVNFLGHFLLTQLLLPVLRETPGARVIGQTSVAMANSYKCGIDPQSWISRRPDFQDWKQYGQSKLAIQLFMEQLQNREPSLLCMACHPGVVADTTLLHQAGIGITETFFSALLFKVLAMSADTGHLNTVFLASAPSSELDPGACYQPIGRKLYWRASLFQRVAAFQAPVAMTTSFPDLWQVADKMIRERSNASQ